MFEFDPSVSKIIDKSNGDQLVTTHAHRQSDHISMAILSADGAKKFAFTIKSYSIDEPDTWRDDDVSRVILLSSCEYLPDGSSRVVFDMHPDIERFIEFKCRTAKSKLNFVGFEFVDKRKKPRQNSSFLHLRTQ